MVEKKIDSSSLQKSDLDTILQVNKKAIELQTEISEQHEEIIAIAQENTKEIKNTGEDIIRAIERLGDKLDKSSDDIHLIKKNMDEINRLQFKILLLISSGIVSLLLQVFILLRK